MPAQRLVRCSRDYVIACCDEAARRREALRGKVPRHFVVSCFSHLLYFGQLLPGMRFTNTFLCAAYAKCYHTQLGENVLEALAPETMDSRAHGWRAYSNIDSIFSTCQAFQYGSKGLYLLELYCRQITQDVEGRIEGVQTSPSAWYLCC